MSVRTSNTRSASGSRQGAAALNVATMAPHQLHHLGELHLGRAI
ncbi:hypothetical protein [Streptomyces sp. NBC_00299]